MANACWDLGEIPDGSKIPNQHLIKGIFIKSYEYPRIIVIFKEIGSANCVRPSVILVKLSSIDTRASESIRITRHWLKPPSAAPRSRHHGDLPPNQALMLVHRQDYLQGLGIPAVILTSRLVPAEAASGGSGTGPITRAGTTMTSPQCNISPGNSFSTRKQRLPRRICRFSSALPMEGPRPPARAVRASDSS